MKTIKGVPIAQTGIEYPASTGPVTFTEEDLADMVAAQDDPAIVCPRLKLGHIDARFNTALADGEPAFGLATNLRLENNGNTVVCDYEGVPDWLADVLPSAYPNRSVEGHWDVETVTGHKWRFVCTDVALLGVVWPGISTLDDLQTALSDAGPEGVEVEPTETVQATGTLSAKVKEMLASVNLEDVRRQFYDEVATQETGRYWWWVRAVLLDPNELIVDDDDGGLYRVPFSTDGEDVTFDDPVPVKINYVDAPEPVAASAASVGAVMAAVYDHRPETRQKEAPVEGSSTSPGTPPAEETAATVDLTLLRKHLGLKDDATEEEVNAALAAAGETPAGGEEDEPEEEDTPSAAELAASGTVTIDKETLATLQRNSQLGLTAFERQRVSDRDQFLAAALAAGKFPPSRLKHWTEAWETEHKVHGNADGIKATIEQMPAGLIPVSQLGGQPNTEAASGEAYPAGWLPEVARRKARAEARITQEA